MLLPLTLPAQDLVFPFIGRPIAFLSPTVDGAGKTVVFGSAITPSGDTANTTDIYVAVSDGTGLRRLTQFPASTVAPAGAATVALSADGKKAAYTLLPTPPGVNKEEVHVLDIASGKDVTAAVYTEGCIQPLSLDSLCVNCLATCVHAPHLSADGSKVLYQVASSPSFFVANSDGTGLTRLPVYIGSLAPAPARVISNTGLVVFTSNAPSGPTFAASATDVYVMNLDGTNIRPVTHFGNDLSSYAWNAVISADGSTVAFEMNSPGPISTSGAPPPQVWVVASGGSNLRQVGSGTNPSLSADGSMLTMLSDGQILAMRTFGESPVGRLTNFQLSSARDPVLSDDGSRVVFDIGPKGGGIGAIYSVGADGTNLATVYAPRALNPPATSASGGLISAYGTNFAGDGLVVAPSIPLPQALAGASLLINGAPAPLLAITPWQINGQVPPSVAVGTASFQMQFADGTKTDPVKADVASIAPAIFYYQVDTNPFIWQAAVLHAGTGIPADAAHPAVAGEALEIYGTGLGATDPPVPVGTAAPIPPAQTVITPQVMLGSKPATVLFSGLTPGLVGLYQVNVIVPSGMGAGRTSVTWVSGSTRSDSVGTIALR